MDDCEHSVILDYFSRKYFNMKDNVEVVDTLSGKTIRVDNDQYIRLFICYLIYICFIVLLFTNKRLLLWLHILDLSLR